jgi:hypothetical protein
VDREKRLRRVLLICAHFTLHVAYSRAGYRRRTGIVRGARFSIDVAPAVQAVV